MFLIWEGVDKVGKDTLKAHVDKATAWQHVNLNRGPLGYMAYDKIYERETPKTLAQHEHEWDMIKDNCLIIFLAGDSNVLYTRIEDAGDELIPVEELDRQQNVYFETILEYVTECDVLYIDTTRNTLDECRDMILSRLREIQFTTHLARVRSNAHFMIEQTDKPGSRCTFYDPVRLTLTPGLLQGFVPFDVDVDKAYYEQLAWSCLQRLHMFNEEIINVRQVVVAQEDCICLIQFDMAQYVLKGELIIYAHQRSWNVAGHGVNDWTFYKWLVEKAVEEGELEKGTENNFKVHWQCVYPHEFS